MEVFKPVINVVLSECPGEISLGIMVAGCPYGCKGCSYKSLEKFGRVELTLSMFEEELRKYHNQATAVVFMGGCWLGNELTVYLERSKSNGYKTCLYTGLKNIGEIEPSIIKNLDYCKYGRWEGIPLAEKNSNQRFWDIKNNTDLTYKFQIGK
ncbi:MAG: hypothetical protein M0P12_00430 [Paludibacteraceae bacterium]|jgi:anaerobic ribonucleoside-triphosphate reductase activating protein|nr:hypothetical protein [Paludibacteraceae bacterium]